MAAGDVLRELIGAEKVTVKADEDIEKGEIIYNDGNGFLAMPNSAPAAKAYMALEVHDYSAVSYHDIAAIGLGKVVVQKATGTAIKKGDKVIISSTAGEITKLTKGDAPSGGVSTYYTATIETNMQTALDTNLRVIGSCAKDAASDDTTCEIWLGVL